MEPSSNFYDKAMQLWLRLDSNNEGNLEFSNFLSSFKNIFGIAWKDKLIEPTKKFFDVVKKSSLTLYSE